MFHNVRRTLVRVLLLRILIVVWEINAATAPTVVHNQKVKRVQSRQK